MNRKEREEYNKAFEEYQRAKRGATAISFHAAIKAFDADRRRNAKIQADMARKVIRACLGRTHRNEQKD